MEIQKCGGKRFCFGTEKKQGRGELVGSHHFIKGIIVNVLMARLASQQSHGFNSVKIYGQYLNF